MLIQLRHLVQEVLDLMSSQEYIGCGSTVAVEGGSLFNKLRMERLNPFFRCFKYSGGVFLLCRKEAFQAIQGFSLGLYAYEEFDFICRLKRYGRSKGKRFTVLHRHPVITSGRKGASGANILSIFVSNMAALLLFGLYHVLPAKVFGKINSKFLGYWYKHRTDQ